MFFRYTIINLDENLFNKTPLLLNITEDNNCCEILLIIQNSVWNREDQLCD